MCCLLGDTSGSSSSELLTGKWVSSDFWIIDVGGIAGSVASFLLLNAKMLWPAIESVNVGKVPAVNVVVSWSRNG